jgi:hypothetical protein
MSFLEGMSQQFEPSLEQGIGAAGTVKSCLTGSKSNPTFQKPLEIPQLVKTQAFGMVRRAVPQPHDSHTHFID